MNNYLKCIKIDECSITPKYLQLTHAILQGIRKEEIKKNDILPSINELSILLETARNTVERAYKELKKMGLVTPIAGKGCFISATHFNNPVKILLLFNKLSLHKKIIYDAFAATLGNEAAIDFYIYNNDFNLFKKLLDEKANAYSKCVIIPNFTTCKEMGYALIDTIPKNKLVLMGKLADHITGDFTAVYENFETDLFNALEELRPNLAKYHTLKIIFPENSYYSKKILCGFTNFCMKYAYRNQVINCIATEKIESGAVYITLMEDDLVTLVERVMEQDLNVGKDIGVISYNETPLKKIILDGITTISTDFKMMGEKTAEFILANVTTHLAIPFSVTLRNSL